MIIAKNCTIIPLYPASLNVADGEIYSGTPYVMITCNCSELYPEDAVWYFSNGTKIPLQYAIADDSPYTIQGNGTLVFPRFNHLYEGTYLCGVKNGSSNTADINLKVSYGKCSYIVMWLLIEGLNRKRGEAPFGKLGDLLVSIKWNF